MKPSKEFVAYKLTDPDYKNRIASVYFASYTVFLPELKKFKEQAEVILEAIEKRK